MADTRGAAGRFLLGLESGPQRTALRVGGATLSYAEVHRGALDLAGAVLASGPPRQARVGVLASGTATAYVGVLAAIYAGTAAVPLNPDFPAARTISMIRAAGLDTVIADQRGANVFTSLGDAVAGIRCIQAGPAGQSSGSGPALDAPLPRHPADAAYVMFTSGSTGRPKGVPVSHGNLLHFLDAAGARYQFSPADTLAQTFEPTFDLFMFGLFMAWSAGATLVAVPPAVFRRLPDFAADQGISVWFSVPSAIRLLRRLGRLRPACLPGLTWSLFCGEALTLQDAAAWAAAAPGGTLENLYGPTELTIACTAYRWRPGQPADPLANGLVPIGTPYRGLRYLLADDGRPTTAADGELCVSGPQMFAGYLDQADDQDRFLTCDDVRWYRTGDRVRLLPGGDLAYLGRLDSQTKIRGYRVEPLEVEHALRQLDGIRDCAVVAVRRDGETQLAAAYTGSQSAPGLLARQLAGQLPEYMVPRIIAQIAELPLNSNGKVDRQVLAGWALGADVARRDEGSD